MGRVFVHFTKNKDRQLVINTGSLTFCTLLQLLILCVKANQLLHCNCKGRFLSLNLGCGLVFIQGTDGCTQHFKLYVAFIDALHTRFKYEAIFLLYLHLHVVFLLIPLNFFHPYIKFLCNSHFRWKT